MPFLTFVYWMLWSQVDVSEPEDHLYSNVPELFLQIDMQPILKVVFAIQVHVVGSLFGRAKGTGLMHYHGVPSKLNSVPTLVYVPRRLYIHEWVIEQRNHAIDYLFNRRIESSILGRMHVVDVRGNAKESN